MRLHGNCVGSCYLARVVTKEGGVDRAKGDRDLEGRARLGVGKELEVEGGGRGSSLVPVVNEGSRACPLPKEKIGVVGAEVRGKQFARLDEVSGQREGRGCGDVTWEKGVRR